jgi:hypothetical protein
MNWRTVAYRWHVLVRHGELRLGETRSGMVWNGWAALALLAGAVGTSAQSTSTADARKSKDQPPPRQVNVAIDPRSEGEAQSALIVKGFGTSCPNVSIIRDESKAEYVILASESNPWRGLLLHYFITVYDKQGKVVFATDKHHGKNASEAACQFINAQK